MDKVFTCVLVVVFLAAMSVSFVSAEIVFESDWSTATGVSSEAWSDGGKWMQQGNPGWAQLIPDTGGVVSATNLGFPNSMANVLRVGYTGKPPGTQGGGSSVRVPGTNNPYWSAPSVGETLFHRFYMRHSIHNHSSNLGAGSHHPFQGTPENDAELGNVCAAHWEYKWGSSTDGTHNFGVVYIMGGVERYLSGLNKDQVYLYEVAYTKTAANTYTVRVRLDGEDITELMNVPSTPITIGDYCIGTLYIGNNDPVDWRNTDQTPFDDGPYPDQDFVYWGGVAVGVSSDPDDWIGPYGNVSSPLQDTSPPVITIVAPSEDHVFTAGTNSTTLTVSTDEVATCRYGTSNVSYASLPNLFSGAGTTNHSATLFGLSDGGLYTYYVSCQDTFGNTIQTSSSRSFSVAQLEEGSLSWFSDWSTATGYSEHAVRDGGKWPVMAWWTGTGDPSTNGRVVSAQGLGFPAGMDNVLLTTLHENPGSSGNVLVRASDDLWPVPAVGETLFHRWYMRFDVRDEAGTYPAGSSYHPFQGYDNTVSPSCTHHWETKFGIQDSGTFSFQVVYPQAYPSYAFNLQGLPKWQAHLFEVGFTKVAADMYDVRVRVNGVDRTVDFDGDFVNRGPFHISDYCLRTLFLGNNDPGPGWYSLDASQDFVYWGGVAVAVSGNSDDWIGPYGQTINSFLGDVNGDGVVNVNDILIVVNDFRKSSFDSRADVNGDGVVNVFDLVLVARDFGRSTSSPPQPSNMWDLKSNEPEGFTVLQEAPWDVIEWPVATNRHPGTYPYLEQDATAPDGDPDVLRQTYEGVPDGHEPMFLYPSLGGEYDAMYYASYVKFDETWAQPAWSGIKWHIPLTNDGQWIGWIGLGPSQIDPGAPKIGMVLDSSATYGGRLAYETLDVPLTRGEWHKVQYLIENYPTGTDRIRIWVNDQIVLDSNDAPPWTEGTDPVQQSGPLVFNANKQLTGLQMGATWGGGIGYPAPQGSILSYAHTYMSGGQLS